MAHFLVIQAQDRPKDKQITESYPIWVLKFTIQRASVDFKAVGECLCCHAKLDHAGFELPDIHLRTHTSFLFGCRILCHSQKIAHERRVVNGLVADYVKKFFIPQRRCCICANSVI